MPGRLRTVLLRLEVRRAGKLCRCGHDRRHEIRKGEKRFVVSEHGPAAGDKGYCVNCARKMLDASTADLEALRQELDG
jgi:hypothetical protein